MNAPIVTIPLSKVINEKYPFKPSLVCPINPPTRKATAMPIWFAFIAIDVDNALSSLPNHLDDNKVGVH